jgi:hypothetical protein
MKFLILGLIWLAAAVAAGASGALLQLRPPAPQLVVLTLTAALVLAGRLWPAFRAWLAGLGWRSVVALHLSRFVGFAFLWFSSQGRLPATFAVPAGVGDIAVAVLAGGLLLASTSVARHPWLLWACNLLGLADILMVVANAARHAIQDPASMSELLRLPLSVLPTFLVPLIIASHLLLFAKAREVETGKLQGVR